MIDAVALLHLKNLPILCNELWPSSDAAKAAPMGDIDLCACRSCGLIRNRRFDPSKINYAPGYENALHFSSEFRAFADGLARSLIERYGLTGGHVVEIGAGDGYFLQTLVSNGVSSASGFDPSLPEEKIVVDGAVRMLRAAFGPEQLSEPFDALVCRHVVEHLSVPRELLTEMQHALAGGSAPAYVEVPNAAWLIEARSVWDLIYEHVTYWTEVSMAGLFARCGLKVTSCAPVFGGQFLATEGRADGDGTLPDAADVAMDLDKAQSFARDVSAFIDDWSGRLDAIDGTAVVWGAGSKGITFANLMQSSSSDRIVGMVDQNPRKHGKFVPGVGLPVMPPDALRHTDPHLVIISNGIYRNEIRTQLEQLGCNADILVLAE